MPLSPGILYLKSFKARRDVWGSDTKLKKIKSIKCNDLVKKSETKRHMDSKSSKMVEPLSFGEYVEDSSAFDNLR